MSEKRFRYDSALEKVYDEDTYNGETTESYGIFECCEIMNELTEENEQLKFENETLKSNYQREIQSSIDFCNAYSKINGELLEKIEKLEEENEQLREINKELGDDLYNCRLNKNIIREKLKLWQDVHKEYGIYSINDFEELMKNDK